MGHAKGDQRTIADRNSLVYARSVRDGFTRRRGINCSEPQLKLYITSVVPLLRPFLLPLALGGGLPNTPVASDGYRCYYCAAVR
jgi:hypothetical protein